MKKRLPISTESQEKIVIIACKICNVNPERLLLKSKEADINRARKLAAYFLWKGGLTYKSIARRIGHPKLSLQAARHHINDLQDHLKKRGSDESHTLALYVSLMKECLKELSQSEQIKHA